MKEEFKNKAAIIIGDTPSLSPELTQLIFNLAISVDTDLQTLESQTNGSGYAGLTPASCTYQTAVQQLQLFSGVFKDNEPVNDLLAEMRGAIFNYSSKV